MTTHPSHPEHPLEIVNQGRYTCDGCKMEGTGLRYRCELCNYDLHDECMFAPSMIRFQGHNCIFYESPLHGANCIRVDDYCSNCTRNCDACGLTIKGFVYHYSREGWDFHPRCAKLRNKIQVGDVTFWLQKQGLSTCLWCQQQLPPRFTETNGTGLSYVSKYDDYNFHVHCVMEMAIQINSSNRPSSFNGPTSTERDSSSSAIVMHQGMNYLRDVLMKSGSSNSIEWSEILKIFLKTVFSTLVGDPTEIVVSAVAQIVTQRLRNHG